MATFEASSSGSGDRSLRLRKCTTATEVVVPREVGFVDKFRNVTLESEPKAKLAVKESAGGGGSDGSSGGGSCSGRLPLRPYAVDCPFYIRTGTCKFGLTCRYNHPVKRTNLVSEAVKENMDDWSSVDYGKILCKYYLTPGGCKYGDSCRYSHPEDGLEFAVPELNFIGLPIRLGEKECPYYMRHGSCGYGVRCVFHHPEMQMPVGWNEYQASDFPHQKSSQAYLAPGAQTKVESKVSVQGKDSQAVCGYLLKDGDCPYKSTCRFHPKDWVKADICELTDKGLPLRPGKTICRHYESFGLCKYGRACAYDHPLDH